MHGSFEAAHDASAFTEPTLLLRVREVATRRWPFLLFVILPTLLAGIYYSAIAAARYESETMFIVRGLQPDSARVGGLGELLGLGGSFSPAQTEARSVAAYLQSHDVISALDAHKIDLVSIYRRPEADILSRLWYASPKAETLLRYFRRQIDISFDPDDGITRLRVRAYRPEDALAVSRAMLRLGEERINGFNNRALEAALGAASKDVRMAEAELTDIQARLTTFRDRNRDIDPRRNSEGQMSLVGKIESQLVQQRAELANLGRFLAADSPQLVAQRSRIAALEAQLVAERAELTGSSAALAPRLAGYEELQLRQEFAAKRYEAARGALEAARLQALKQRLFVVAVVEPNLPEKETEPKRFTIVFGLFAGLLVAYGIGWLLVVGVREHGA